MAIDDYAHGVVAANEFVRPTRPRAEAPGRRAPAAAAAAQRGYGMRGRLDAAGGRAGQRVRGAAAARLARSMDDEGDDEGDDEWDDEEA